MPNLNTTVQTSKDKCEPGRDDFNVLIPAVIAERNQVFLPLVRAIAAGRTGPPARGFAAGGLAETPDTKPYDLGDAMGRPYINDCVHARGS